MLRKRRIGYYYETLLQWFKKYCGYEEGVTIDAFSYDWRQEIGHPKLQEDLRKCIKAMRCRNGGQRLTVIAHSLGGLVVQAYMQTYPDWNDDISRFAAISVPFDGVGGYSMAGFLTGYCLRLPIPMSCGRGIQGASGSIISMAGRPGAAPAAVSSSALTYTSSACSVRVLVVAVITTAIIMIQAVTLLAISTLLVILAQS